jgi:hypothetical protein
LTFFTFRKGDGYGNMELRVGKNYDFHICNVLDIKSACCNVFRHGTIPRNKSHDDASISVFGIIGKNGRGSINSKFNSDVRSRVALRVERKERTIKIRIPI